MTDHSTRHVTYAVDLARAAGIKTAVRGDTLHIGHRRIRIDDDQVSVMDLDAAIKSALADAAEARQGLPATPVADKAPEAAHKAAALADGWVIGAHGKWHNPTRKSGACYADTPRAFRYICEDHDLSVSAG